MLYFGQKGKLAVAVYEKGPKVVVQGKETEDFIRFYLEPEILGEAKLGYEEELNPEMFSAHFGVDESGKGDFWTPRGRWRLRGCLRLPGPPGGGSHGQQEDQLGCPYPGAVQGDPRYTRADQRCPRGSGRKPTTGSWRSSAMRNRVLAWGHARIIENLLEKRPNRLRSLSDQFGNPALIKRALLEKGRKIELQQRTKAESDPAVAAASILARTGFIDWMDRRGANWGITLPRGASAAVRGMWFTTGEGPWDRNPAIRREDAFPYSGANSPGSIRHRRHKNQYPNRKRQTW